MNGIQADAGAYRRHGVRIVGSNVVTANHLKVPDLMRELSNEYEKKANDILARVTKVHSRFEQIHPFSDGNGRVGRLLMNAMLLKKNLPPALIFQEARKFYMLYLNQSQTEADFSRLEDFLCDAVLGAYALMQVSEEDVSGGNVAKEPEEIYGKILRRLARAQMAA